MGASFHRWDTGELSNGAGGSNQEEERATASNDSWMEPLVPRGACDH